ncbi:MAG TPA: hypothetical protein VNV62_17135 [Trebonia sp.]|jgi:hypothetical protein|nr:hypothetical protein [Trebonia sp.]
MTIGPPDAADMLPAACRLLASMKYRIDDVMEALWRFPEITAAVLRDPVFRMIGTSGAVLVPDGIDWLEAVGRSPAIDEDLWLAERSSTGAAEEPLVYAIAPHWFARLVLPSNADGDADGGRYRQFTATDMALEEIDPSLVIGGTYQRGWSRTLSAGELDEVNAKAAAASPGRDTAYVRIGRLPLYVAVEGKNRVRAFRAAGKAINAFTCTAPFPEPEALELHEIVNSCGAFSGVAVSDTGSGAVRVLALSSVTAPVLEAYGVRWGRTLPPDAADHRGRPLGAARRAVLEDLVRHFMHP